MLQRLRALFGAQDMTEGPPLRELIRFSLPLLIGNFVQQLYSAVDAIVVTRAVPNGLAAIGATGPLINLFILIFMAIATGAGIVVSQYFGAKEEEKLATSIGNTLTMVLIAGVIITAVAVPLSGPFLRLLDTPEDILAMSTAYMQILFIGTLASAYYNIVSGILRGLGDAFSPLLFLLLASILNTVLDLIFVWGFSWGVPGAAWATIISQAVSAVLCLVRLYRLKGIRRLSPGDLRPQGGIIGQILRLGIPAGITQGIFSLAMLMVQRLANQMGTLVLNANTAVMRVDGFAMLPNFTFGMAVSTFIGQNIGARKMERVRRGGKIAARLALVVSLTLTVILLLFGRYLLLLFSDDPMVIEIGYRMIAILAVGYVAVSQSQVYGGILRGAGDTMPALWISLFTTVIIRVPLAYLLAYLTRSPEWPHGSPYVLSISLLATWVLGAVATYLWYRLGNWRDKAIV